MLFRLNYILGHVYDLRTEKNKGKKTLNIQFCYLKYLSIGPVQCVHMNV